MKTTILIIGLLFTSSFANAQTGYPYIIQNISWNNTPAVLKNFTGDIISPYDDAQPVTVDGTADVEFHGGYSVTLNPGFTASATTGAFNFRAVIDEEIESVVITPDPSTSIDANGIIHVNKWEKLEIGFTLPQKYQAAVNNFFNHYFPPGNGNPSSDYDLNPYADDSLLIRIDLTSPSNQIITKWGFFMREARWGADVVQGYPGSAFLEEDVNDVNYKYFYRLRFAPDEVSTQPWSLSINLSAPNTKDAATDPLLDFTFPGFTFICDAPLSANHGYVKVNANNNRYLKFDDGTPYFPIGENLLYGYSNINSNVKWYRFYKFNYEQIIKAIDEMSSVGGNFGRFLFFNRMCPIEFEHLGVYDQAVSEFACYASDTMTINHQHEAWMFDRILDRTREKNIYLQLYVDPNNPALGGESYIWGNHCYLKQFCPDYGQQGFAFDPSPFFCDVINQNFDMSDPATALYWYKRKYKYILSRWGYSVNIALIEPFGEVDNLLGYFESNQTTNGSLCPPNRLNWTNSNLSNLQLAEDEWYTRMIGLIKLPVSSGGLGETNHLFTSSYTPNALWVHLPIVADVCNPSLEDYYTLFNNNKVDILDIHHYDFFAQTGNNWRFKSYSGNLSQGCTPPNNLRFAFTNPKPMHHGELGHWGNMYNGPNDPDGIPTFHYFNNYDVSFHNEIWSTAMSGFLGAGSTWFTNVVHRWKDGNPEPPNGNANEIGDQYSLFKVISRTGIGFEYVPSSNNDDKIKSCYHNLKPLSDFISLLASNNFFDQNIVPHKYYNYDPANGNYDVVESYYLVNEDQTYACGWIHNINKYWANAFIYTDQDHAGEENYYGCEREGLVHPPATSFKLEGFEPNKNYWIEFYHTRWGTDPLPYSQGILSNNSGEIEIDLSSAPLACDSFNADYAFTAIIVPSPQRMAQGANEKYDNNFNALDFTIYPNPSIREARIALPIDDRSELSILDMVGRIVQKISPINQDNILFDLSLISKGSYLVKLKNSHGEKVKRLIIH